MDLAPLSVLADGNRDQGVADAQFILNTLLSQANAQEGAGAGDQVTATGTYYGPTFMKVWRYILEETITIAVPRNSFFASTQRMNFRVGTQDCVVIFDETANTITVETLKP